MMVDMLTKKLCKELLRFLHSIDETGLALRQTVRDLGIAPENALDVQIPIEELSSPSPDLPKLAITEGQSGG